MDIPMNCVILDRLLFPAFLQKQGRDESVNLLSFVDLK